MANTKAIFVNPYGDAPGGGSVEGYKDALSIGCVPMQQGVSSSYSLEVGRTNAELIQTELWNGFHVIVNPTQFAIADHDADGIDILMPPYYGPCILGNGIHDRRIWAPGSEVNKAATFIHIHDPDDTDYQATMIQYMGWGGEIRVCLVGGLAFNATQAQAIFDNNQMAKCGFRFYNSAESLTGNKVRGTSIVTNCQIGAQFDFSGPGEEDHTDHMEWEWFGVRYCKIGYQSLNKNSLDHHFNMLTNSGSPMDALLDFQKGGALVVDYGYAANGTTLRIGEGTANGSNTFVFSELRADNIVLQQDNCILVDCQDMDSYTKVRMNAHLGDNSGYFDGRQLIRTKSRVTGARAYSDIQVDIHHLGSEAAAYPLRPLPFFRMPSFVEKNILSSTKLWFDPDERTGWTYNGDEAEGVEILTAADLVPGGHSFVKHSTGGIGPTLRTRAQNLTDVLERTAAVLTADQVGISPIGSFTIFANVHSTSVVGTNKVLLSLRNTNNTGGLYLQLNNDALTAGIESQAVTSTQLLEGERWYLVVFRRNAATGEIQITINGVTTTSTGGSTSTVSPTGKWILGGLMNGTTPSGFWSRAIGAITYDNEYWQTSDAKYIQRRNYFRQRGVW